MPPRDAKDLLKRYHQGQVTEAEKALVESWYLKQISPAMEVDSRQTEEDKAESLDKLLDQISPTPLKRLWPRYAVAASVLLASLGFFIQKDNQVVQQKTYASVTHEIMPGGNKAILVLGNGQKVSLADVKNGKIASQGNVVIKKTGSGQITYSNSNIVAVATQNIYNTAITPRGGQFAFTLADGTKVWLNAASSLRFPVAFNGSERKVELTGEAYFEVAHDAKKPFKVSVGTQVVEDLGTEFNINAYADEETVNTTLLKGSIKVSTTNTSNILKPGEQAQLKGGVINIIADADLDEATGWKNGLFNFKDAYIKTVMRQMSRWYDADVSYSANLPDRRFSGEISRDLTASQMLDILSFKKIRFKIEGKKITITN